MNKARITYRFDQEKEQFDKETPHAAPVLEKVSRTDKDNAKDRHNESGSDKIHDSQMLNQFTSDYGAWSSPFDIETEKLEQLIRNSRHEPASDDSQDNRKHRDEWSDGFSQWTDLDSSDLPDEQQHSGPIIDPEVEESTVNRSRRSSSPASSYVTSYRPARTPWLRIVLSVVGAVATGVLFGLFVMQLFTDLVLDRGTPLAPVDSSLHVPNSGAGSGTSSGAAGNPEEGIVAVQVPERTVYMLQFGVFSTLEGAKAAQNQLAEAGIASAYEAGDQHIVYAGLTPDRNSALLLSDQLERMDLETYVKPFERPAVTGLQWGAAEGAQVEAYFTDGGQLAQTVALLTLVHLEETALTNFEEATMQALQAAHQDWLLAANQVSGEVPDQSRDIFDQMNNELTYAVQSLLEYSKNPSTSYLWQAQSAVMNYVILERSLLAALAV